MINFLNSGKFLNDDKKIKNVIITGGSGFIGTNLVKHLINTTNFKILNIDNLTYASNKHSLKSISKSSQYQFLKLDISNPDKLDDIFNNFKPNLVMHLAAESHVDRSIEKPNNFIKTNIFGTYNLLMASLNYWNSKRQGVNKNFFFHHISTDEVFGDKKNISNDFINLNCYKPSSPYSASKASADHLVRALIELMIYQSV